MRFAVSTIVAVVVLLAGCQALSGLDKVEVERGSVLGGAGTRSDLPATGGSTANETAADGSDASVLASGGSHADVPAAGASGSMAPKEHTDCKVTLPGADCDPLTQCMCGPDASCVLLTTNSAKTEYTAECEVAGTGKIGADCDDTDDCSPGFVCNVATKMCTHYCASDADCGTGACQPHFSDKTYLGFGTCLMACDRATGEPCSATSVCATVNLPQYFTPGDYCMLPAQAGACPQNNGVCDEPEGTNFCVEGADPHDCCKLDGMGECDPVLQCGCESDPSTHCQVRRDLFSTPDPAHGICNPIGALAPGSLCDSEAGCPQGQDCIGGVCRKYCRTFMDCGADDLCHPLHVTQGDDAILGTCLLACDFATGEPCAVGTVCAQLDSHTVCWLPESMCESGLTHNEVCDDTREGGTRLCAMGTDPECN